ncbi:MAG TPA: LysM peptidoglycan-binding domain-containing protein, partial [Vitreimonas sp.]|nr:LysM peptidoglycan-binding domain-containing protein [Vitreimonas sp.]
MLPLAVVAIVTAASVLSWLPGSPARGAVGGTTSDMAGPRVAFDEGARSYGELTPVYGRADGPPASGEPAAEALEPLRAPPPDYRRIDPDAAAAARAGTTTDASAVSGPFLPDGTLLKPIAVTTTLADGKDLLESYEVRKGDSVGSIAKRFGVSQMSVVWANDLTSLRLEVGRTLVIPPFNGVVHTVEEGDSLEALAKQYDIDADRIYRTNGLEDRVLIAGQTLMLPGAKGAPLPTPRSVARPTAGNGGGSSGGNSGGATTVRPPTTYTGGAMAWPVVGGGNYISQYYR